MVLGGVLLRSQKEHVFAKVGQAVYLLHRAILWALRIDQVATRDEHARGTFLDILIRNEEATHGIGQPEEPVKPVVDLGFAECLTEASTIPEVMLTAITFKAQPWPN